MPRALIAAALCCSMTTATFAAESQVGYSVTYSGGSLPNIKGGQDLRLYLDSRRISLRHKSSSVALIAAKDITEISYGQEVHRRIGTAAGLAVVSLGIGAIVAFSKSKKHYIGITWAGADGNGGIVLQADKNEYRGLLTALEGVSGRSAVDTDSPRQAPQPTMSSRTANPTNPPPQVRTETQPADSQVQQRIMVRFTSTPANAEVQIDGEYWGSTPTGNLSRLTAGSHTIVVKKLNYQPWERKITLAAGDDRTIDAELELDKDPNKPRILGQQ